LKSRNAKTQLTPGAPESEKDEPLGFLIHEVANAISQGYSRVMAPLGLTRPQVRVLVWVDHSPGITQTELCELIGTSPMALTGLLDRMEAKNLVKREENPADRRAKRIFLTDGALALKPEMEKIAADFRQAVRAGLDPDEIATAQRVLAIMKANADEARRGNDD
jgi:DNA-binding MarR family transcriptional regulator